MSNQNKILIAAVAVVAFIIGAAINSARITNISSATQLLSAKLLTANAEEQVVSEQLGQITLINFWASWCAPCRREMPLFQAVYEREQANGFKIIGIAIDTPDNTVAMTDSMGITYPILFAEQTGIKLMELSGNDTGAMPYSLLLDQDGNVIDQKLGEIHEPQLLAWSKGQKYEAKQ